MKKFKLALPVLAVLMTTGLFSCKESDTSKLQDAQLCLNSATSASAMGCVENISSDVSPIAYSLRCSAIFISQGFGSAASFVDALASINEPANCTGCSPTVNALNSFKFTAAGVLTPTERTANNSAAALAFTQCSQADAKIYTQIASLFRLGTLTSMLAYNTSGGATFTQDQLAAELQNLSPTDVGAIVTVTYSTSCQNLENASDTTQTYCAQLKTALDGGSNETAIGQCLIEKLQDPNYSVPPCI